MGRIPRFIDAFSTWVMKGVRWLTLFLVLITALDVSLRYLFHSGSIQVQELEWHIFALIFLLGAGSALLEGSHVRVDLLYGKLPPRGKALIDTLGALFFLLPFCVLLFWVSLPFVENSFNIMERSPEPGGLPYRFIIKGAIPLGFLLLGLQGVSEFLKSLLVLIKRKEA